MVDCIYLRNMALALPKKARNSPKYGFNKAVYSHRLFFTTTLVNPRYIQRSLYRHFMKNNFLFYLYPSVMLNSNTKEKGKCEVTVKVKN
jgi:hypothetical protein